MFTVFAYIHCEHLQSHSALLVYLGERTGSLLGIISLSISDFYILIFSHPSYSWFQCLILSHTAFLLGAYTLPRPVLDLTVLGSSPSSPWVCVHHASVFCVCTLCFSTSSFFLFLMHTSCVFFLCIHACTPMWYIIPRHPFGGLYNWRAISIYEGS